MRIAELVLDFVNVLAWPILVLVVLLVFRSQVRALAARLASFSGPGVSATFHEASKEAAALVKENPPTKPGPQPSRSTRRYEVTSLSESALFGHAFRSGRDIEIDVAQASLSEGLKIISFASGLVFGAKGSLERVSDKRLLLRHLGPSDDESTKVG
ncbi:cell division protein SepF [Nocardioides sp. Leaf374]|uniref:cell division protein SepF n=1 Tax=Nocardioides sp. Leaf374 TaxID=2876560 RepID=UPI001E5686A7|nr:cell division protein SepF [Nocardioides sp. Leaf374]